MQSYGLSRSADGSRASSAGCRFLPSGVAGSFLVSRQRQLAGWGISAQTLEVALHTDSGACGFWWAIALTVLIGKFC